MSELFITPLIRRGAAAIAGRVSASASRRDIARALAGLALGGGSATRYGTDDIDARKKRKNRNKKKRKTNRCKNDEKKCGKQCIPKGDCCNSGDCEQGELCAQGTCVVGRGSCEVGDDVCVDLEHTCGGGNCYCITSTAGATRCIPDFGTLSDCGTCVNDDDCRELFPDVPGAFCGASLGPNCECGGLCYGPCGFSD